MDEGDRVGPKRPVLLCVALFAGVVSLVHLVAWSSGSAEIAERLETWTGGGPWLIWPTLLFLTVVELRTDLFAMRVSAILYLVVQAFFFGAHRWLRLRTACTDLETHALQGVWLVAVPLFLALILHAERRIISWRWKEPGSEGE